MQKCFLNNKSRNDCLHALCHRLRVVLSGLPHFLNEDRDEFDQILIEHPDQVRLLLGNQSEPIVALLNLLVVQVVKLVYKLVVEQSDIFYRLQHHSSERNLRFQLVVKGLERVSRRFYHVVRRLRDLCGKRTVLIFQL